MKQKVLFHQIRTRYRDDRNQWSSNCFLKYPIWPDLTPFAFSFHFPNWKKWFGGTELTGYYYKQDAEAIKLYWKKYIELKVDYVEI